MERTCECCQCGKIFGRENTNACKLEIWTFCSVECLQAWIVGSAEGLDDDDFDNEGDADDAE